MVAATIASTVAAQRNVEWGVETAAGAGAVSNMPGNSNSRFAYKIGGSVDIPLAKKFSLQPALLFSHNSTGVDGYFGSEQIVGARYRITLDYIELPIHAVFHIPVSKRGTALFIKYGPYVAYGLRGKARVGVPDSDYDETMPGSLFDGGCDFYGVALDNNRQPFSLPAFKRWDYGLSARLGIECRHVAVGVGLNFGFANITHKPTNDNGIANLLGHVFLSNGSGKPRRYEVLFCVGYKI